MSAIGSPPAIRSFSTVMSAPICFKISITPVRVGLMPTASKVTSEPSVIAAPTIKKAADEISDGT